MQTVIVAIWLAANIVLLSRRFDPFPIGGAQNERLLTGNTEILKQGCRARSADPDMGRTILDAVGAGSVAKDSKG